MPLIKDPNVMSDDGTVSVGTTAFTEDGELLGYGAALCASNMMFLNSFSSYFCGN